MTSTPLAELVHPGPQFARSVNIERDASVAGLDGYLPTGRALDVLRRFAFAMRNPSLTRAWSITGPYGSGKSSLALVLDALAGPIDDPTRDRALRLVADVHKATATELGEALSSTGARAGFVRAGVTAQREPVERTVIRALVAGLRRYSAAPRRRDMLVKEAERLLQAPLLPARAVADLVGEAAGIAPVLLVIDEFGKNLEFFTDRPAEADLFVLQEIVERASGPTGLPIYVLTLQHLAFEDYATGATVSQRREWAKVQGRFEDVPFADSPSEVLQLVSRVFHQTADADAKFTSAVERWAKDHYTQVERLALTDRLASPAMLAACYPLHPLTLAVLPDLCSRYGQRERTLFSFLARPEPHSVASFLEDTAVNHRNMPTVGIEQVFDYFMASTGTIMATADGASRWLEIDSRIRETQGLSEVEQRVLKVAGVLNLVSRGGIFRASRDMLDYALGDIADIDQVLAGLESRGMLVHRAFADEYRIWHGTDFDLHGAIDDARRRFRSESVAQVCERALPLAPLVAARHSQDKGILRFFDRSYADSSGMVRRSLADAHADGLLLYVVDDTPPEAFAEAADGYDRPLLLVYPGDSVGLIGAAQDAAAVAEVLASNDSLAEDWVARRELHERAALAVDRFRSALDHAFVLGGEYTRLVRPDGECVELRGRRTWSAVLSDVCDVAYTAGPTVRNEMLARRELSSQAARARRDLLSAMVEQGGKLHLGIEGYGPERAMLDSVLVYSGIYRRLETGWRFCEPFADSDYQPAWQQIEALFADGLGRRVGLDEVWRILQAPPIGLPEGPIPVLVTAALLVHAADIAVYQDGTFQPVFGAELIERLLKSPDRFAVKHFATSGPRGKVLAALADCLPPSATRGRNATLIRVLSPLVRTVRGLEDYTRRTTNLDDQAKAVRDALAHAVEPDELLFAALPAAVGMNTFSPHGRITEARAEEFAARVMEALRKLGLAYPTLIRRLVDTLGASIGRPSPATLQDVRAHLSVRAAGLADKVIEPRLRSFLLAAADAALDDPDWIENLARNVAERPPRAWRDDDRRRFDANLEELLRAFRRVEMLHLKHLDNHPGAARARQVVVTTPQGEVREGIVWLDDSVDSEVERIVGDAVVQATKLVGRRASETLLAVLAERLFADTKTDQLADRRVSPQHEKRRRNG